MSKGKDFRELLESDGITVRPSIQDALTAQIAERVGFTVIGISGFATSTCMFGLPDSGYITLNDMLSQSRRITSAIDIPVIADFDTGYGNALNVRRATKEAITTTELAGIRIEDQLAPKRCGHLSGKRVIPREEAIGKFQAACDIRDKLDNDFVIVARTDARGAVNGDLDEAIERVNTYYEIGADVVFVEGPTSLEEVKRIGTEVDAPLIYNNLTGGDGISPLLDHETLDEFGYDFIIYLSSLTPTAVAVYNHLEGLRKDGSEHEEQFQADIEDHSMADLFAIPNGADIKELEREYLPEEELDKYNSSYGHEP